MRVIIITFKGHYLQKQSVKRPTNFFINFYILIFFDKQLQPFFFYNDKLLLRKSMGV